ncbi:hypothetical protein RUND412_007190 [Rhizina undulata]
MFIRKNHLRLLTTARPFRLLSTSSRLTSPLSFAPGPSPPKLPKEQQEEFEALQRASAGAFSTPRLQREPSSSSEADEGLSHPDLRRVAKPEFEGERNPKTGEIGGPKNDPLRHGDWSFNGRVTDF